MTLPANNLIGYAGAILVARRKDVMPIAKRSRYFSLLSALIWLFCASPFTFVQAEDAPTLPTVLAENLLRAAITGAPDKEVIVNRVSLPPQTKLPWHWHPGEEVFYVIEGAVTLVRRGLPDVLARVGDVQKIAPKTIHTGYTGEDGAELVIFRVHAMGKPERHLVD